MGLLKTIFLRRYLMIKRLWCWLFHKEHHYRGECIEYWYEQYTLYPENPLNPVDLTILIGKRWIWCVQCHCQFKYEHSYGFAPEPQEPNGYWLPVRYWYEELHPVSPPSIP